VEALKKDGSQARVNTANRAHEELFVASQVRIRDRCCGGRRGWCRRMAFQEVSESLALRTRAC